MSTRLNLTSVKRLFREQMRTATVYPGDAFVAFENADFKPTTDTIWLREKLMIAHEKLTAWKTVEAVGQYRIDLFGPVGAGMADIDDLALALLEVFAPATDLQDTELGSSCHIYRSSRQSNSENHAEQSWATVSIVIQWRAHTFLT